MYNMTLKFIIANSADPDEMALCSISAGSALFAEATQYQE